MSHTIRGSWRSNARLFSGSCTGRIKTKRLSGCWACLLIACKLSVLYIQRYIFVKRETLKNQVICEAACAHKQRKTVGNHGCDSIVNNCSAGFSHLEFCYTLLPRNHVIDLTGEVPVGLTWIIDRAFSSEPVTRPWTLRGLPIRRFRDEAAQVVK